MSSKYKSFNNDQIEELFSNYLMDSWSYSKLSSFSRNEKEFEMSYLYMERGRSSASTIAGKAYHYALELYFENLKNGIEIDLVDLERYAFDYIEEIPADEWRIQKTNPSVADCINSATKDASALLTNFAKEISTYKEHIKEILQVEVKITSWLTVNGVDVPLPCNMIIDLVIKTHEDKIVLIDHKSKRAISDEKEVKFSSSKQAITYTLGYEEHFGVKVDEVWFIENKKGKNRNGSPQLIKFSYEMDKDTRRLYEALLYEPLRRMINAISDPDYVYLINDNDSFVDKAEIYDFWVKTQLSEVEDFNIDESKKELISKRLKKIKDSSLTTINPKVLKTFKENTEAFIQYDLSGKNMSNEEKIEHTLRSFGIVTKVQHKFEGFSSCSYLIEVSAGVKLSAIQKYKLDIANALNVPNVRIHKDLMIYENKSYLVIESAIKNTKTLDWDESKLSGLKIPIGVDNFGETIIWDLNNNSTTNMIVCGSVGSGKSVSLISTIHYVIKAGIKDIHVFDPKYEFIDLDGENGIKVYNEIEDIESKMENLVSEMQERVKKKKKKMTLIFIDEMADAIANSKKGAALKIYGEVQDGSYADGRPKMKRVHTGTKKSLSENLQILLQKGRSSGYRVVSATQRASTQVITGETKNNFPVQVCFRVAKDVDSNVVLGESGAETLNGEGDGLIRSPEYLNTIRFQGFYKG